MDDDHILDALLSENPDDSDNSDDMETVSFRGLPYKLVAKASKITGSPNYGDEVDFYTTEINQPGDELSGQVISVNEDSFSKTLRIMTDDGTVYEVPSTLVFPKSSSKTATDSVQLNLLSLDELYDLAQSIADDLDPEGMNDRMYDTIDKYYLVNSRDGLMGWINDAQSKIAKKLATDTRTVDRDGTVVEYEKDDSGTWWAVGLNGSRFNDFDHFYAGDSSEPMDVTWDALRHWRTQDLASRKRGSLALNDSVSYQLDDGTVLDGTVVSIDGSDGTIEVEFSDDDSYDGWYTEQDLTKNSSKTAKKTAGWEYIEDGDGVGGYGADPDQFRYNRNQLDMLTPFQLGDRFLMTKTHDGEVVTAEYEVESLSPEEGVFHLINPEDSRFDFRSGIRVKYDDFVSGIAFHDAKIEKISFFQVEKHVYDAAGNILSVGDKVESTRSSSYLLPTIGREYDNVMGARMFSPGDPIAVIINISYNKNTIDVKWPDNPDERSNNGFSLDAGSVRKISSKTANLRSLAIDRLDIYVANDYIDDIEWDTEYANGPGSISPGQYIQILSVVGDEVIIQSVEGSETAYVDLSDLQSWINAGELTKMDTKDPNEFKYLLHDYDLTKNSSKTADLKGFIKDLLKTTRQNANPISELAGFRVGDKVRYSNGTDPYLSGKVTDIFDAEGGDTSKPILFVQWSDGMLTAHTVNGVEDPNTSLIKISSKTANYNPGDNVTLKSDPGLLGLPAGPAVVKQRGGMPRDQFDMFYGGDEEWNEWGKDTLFYQVEGPADDAGDTVYWVPDWVIGD